MKENKSIVLSLPLSPDLCPDQICYRRWWYVCKQTKHPTVIIHLFQRLLSVCSRFPEVALSVSLSGP